MGLQSNGIYFYTCIRAFFYKLFISLHSMLLKEFCSLHKFSSPWFSFSRFKRTPIKRKGCKIEHIKELPYVFISFCVFFPKLVHQVGKIVFRSRPADIIVLAVNIPVEFVVASVDVKAAVKNPWFSVGNIFVALKVNKKNPSQYFYREGLA